MHGKAVIEFCPAVFIHLHERLVRRVAERESLTVKLTDFCSVAGGECKEFDIVPGVDAALGSSVVHVIVIVPFRKVAGECAEPFFRIGEAEAEERSVERVVVCAADGL